MKGKNNCVRRKRKGKNLCIKKKKCSKTVDPIAEYEQLIVHDFGIQMLDKIMFQEEQAKPYKIICVVREQEGDETEKTTESIIKPNAEC